MPGCTIKGGRALPPTLSTGLQAHGVGELHNTLTFLFLHIQALSLVFDQLRLSQHSCTPKAQVVSLRTSMGRQQETDFQG